MTQWHGGDPDQRDPEADGFDGSGACDAEDLPRYQHRDIRSRRTVRINGGRSMIDC